MARRGVTLGGVSGGPVILVKAGLMTGRRMTVHWEHAAALAELSPGLLIERSLYVIDRERVFLGSVNLDPRSKVVNTEAGMLIGHAAFARETAAGIEAMMSPDNAWRVERDLEGRLVWSDDRGTTHRQPARGVGQRIADGVFRLLPLSPYI